MRAIFAFALFMVLVAGPVSVRAQSVGGSDDSTADTGLSSIVPSAPAATSDDALAQPSEADPAPGGGGWLRSWLHRVDQARASQPHTAAPLVTTHNDLVQQFRYDSYAQQDPNGTWTADYGAGKGLEIIPTTRLEVAVAMPPYLTHQSSVPAGFGDWSFLVKFRAFSKPEGQGAYFVGFFLNGSFPTGNTANSAGHTVWNPMVALGKGWGAFDIQNTFGGTLPDSGAAVLGRTIVLNDVAQYHIKTGNIWPTLEANSTFWEGGHNDGKKQVFLTPEVIFGSFPVAGRLRIAVAAGEQIAVSEFHTYNHRYILSLRLPF
jgi:hypothetical protein